MSVATRDGQNWTHDEVVIALGLYFQIPWGKINQRNPVIIQAAKLLGRTPASLGRKMGNLGRFDKSLADREQKSVVDEAMRVCGVNGSENKRTFTSVMLTKNPSDCLEAIMTFESEIRQGEHTKAKNLAAILMNRLKALP